MAVLGDVLVCTPVSVAGNTGLNSAQSRVSKTIGVTYGVHLLKTIEKQNCLEKNTVVDT